MHAAHAARAATRWAACLLYVCVHACRFFTVEERRTKLGASWYFAYYSDAKAARNVKDAGSAVLLHNISHVSLLASSGRFVLYVSPSSTLSERAKKELSSHKDLVIEVETPERVYFLRAENRHDLLYWAAGLQHMAGLPMDVKWPTAPSTLPRAPRSVLEGRAAAGTLLPEVAAEYDLDADAQPLPVTEPPQPAGVGPRASPAAGVHGAKNAGAAAALVTHHTSGSGVSVPMSPSRSTSLGGSSAQSGGIVPAITIGALDLGAAAIPQPLPASLALGGAAMAPSPARPATPVAATASPLPDAGAKPALPSTPTSAAVQQAQQPKASSTPSAEVKRGPRDMLVIDAGESSDEEADISVQRVSSTGSASADMAAAMRRSSAIDPANVRASAAALLSSPSAAASDSKSAAFSVSSSGVTAPPGAHGLPPRPGSGSSATGPTLLGTLPHVSADGGVGTHRPAPDARTKQSMLEAAILTAAARRTPPAGASRAPSPAHTVSHTAPPAAPAAVLSAARVTPPATGSATGSATGNAAGVGSSSGSVEPSPARGARLGSHKGSIADNFDDEEEHAPVSLGIAARASDVKSGDKPAPRPPLPLGTPQGSTFTKPPAPPSTRAASAQAGAPGGGSVFTFASNSGGRRSPTGGAQPAAAAKASGAPQGVVGSDRDWNSWDDDESDAKPAAPAPDRPPAPPAGGPALPQQPRGLPPSSVLQVRASLTALKPAAPPSKSAATADAAANVHAPAGQGASLGAGVAADKDFVSSNWDDE